MTYIFLLKLKLKIPIIGFRGVYFVLGAGLEPARPQWPLDFKSNVSTNSTIRAGLRAKDGI